MKSIPYLHSVEIGRVEIDCCVANDLPLGGGFKFQQPLLSTKDNLHFEGKFVHSSNRVILLFKQRKIDTSKICTDTSNAADAFKMSIRWIASDLGLGIQTWVVISLWSVIQIT